jgi:hypothetical protein
MDMPSGFGGSDLSPDAISSAVASNPQASGVFGGGAMVGGSATPAGPTAASAPPPTQGNLGEQLGAAAGSDATKGAQSAGAAAAGGGAQAAAPASARSKAKAGIKNLGQGLANAIPVPGMPTSKELPPAPEEAHAAGYQATIQASPIYQRMIASLGPR